MKPTQERENPLFNAWGMAWQALFLFAVWLAVLGSGRAWGFEILYATPTQMVLTGIDANGSTADKYWVIDPGGARTENTNTGRMTIQNPENGVYVLWKHYLDYVYGPPYVWRDAPWMSVTYSGGIRGNIDEPVTVSADAAQFPPTGGFSANVVGAGELTFKDVAFGADSVPRFLLTSEKGQIQFDNCNNFCVSKINAPLLNITNCTGARIAGYYGGQNTNNVIGNLSIVNSFVTDSGYGAITADNISIDKSSCPGWITGNVISIKDSAIGFNSIITANKKLTATGNDFYGLTNLMVPGTTGAEGATITGNTFSRGELRASVESKSTFSNNSVYGNEAQFYGDIALDNNYWGGLDGPVQALQPEYDGWLRSSGALVGGAGAWKVNTPFNRTGTPKATRFAPLGGDQPTVVWVEGLRVGQNALGSNGYCDHSYNPSGGPILARKGRPTLVCFDLRTDDPAGVDTSSFGFYMNVSCYDASGLLKEQYALDPTLGGVKTIYRDYAAGHWDAKRRSLNFIIKANDYHEIRIELKSRIPLHSQMDTNPNSVYTVYTNFLSNTVWEHEFKYTQRPYFGRKLHIGVIRVKIDYQANPQPEHVNNVIERLKGDIPALWPLTEKEFDFTDLGTMPFDGGLFYGIWGTSLTTTGLMNSLATSLALYRYQYNSGISNTYSPMMDIIVGVMPSGILDGEAGANMGVARSACMLDRGHAEAAIHEMGHAIGGLWTGLQEGEEYNQAEGYRKGYKFVDTKGALMRNTVAYNPSSVTSNGIPGGKAVSFPISEALADQQYFDFMGSANPFWILPQSLSQVYGGLASLLGTLPEPTSTGASSPGLPLAMRAAGAASNNRILINGILRWSAVTYSYTLVPESLRARPVNAAEFGVITPAGEPGATLSAYTTSGALVNGTPLALCWDTSVGQYVYRGDLIYWEQTLDYPSTVELGKYKVFDKTIQPRSGLTNSLSATVVSGTGGGPDVVRLKWNSRGAVTGGTPLPLSQVLQYSADNGATWKLVMFPTSGNELDVSPTMVQTGTPLVFRLQTSDGFTTVSSTANITSLAALSGNQQVMILEPIGGDNGPEGTRWRLSAAISGTATQVQWTSSRDGDLGQGERLEDKSLTSGTHVLTCTAMFDGGAPASASVTVDVGVAPDLQLHAGDLSFQAGGVDPAWGVTGWQTAGVNIIRLNVRNTGTAGYWKLRIHITPPGGAETLLSEEAVQLGVFQGHTTSVSYTPTVRGTFSIRGEAVPDTTSTGIPADAPATTDANLSNNTLTITAGNEAPATLPQWVYATTGTSTSFALSGRDPNRDALTYNITAQPSHGGVSGIIPNLVYTPAAGYQGEDELSFTVSDGLATSAPGDVIFRVGNYNAPSSGEFTSVQAPAELTLNQGDSVQTSVIIYPLPLSLNVTNLPPGLGLDGYYLSGTATQAGDYAVTISGSNQYGAGPTANMLIHVVGGIALPPTATSGTASKITAASATLCGTVNPNGVTSTARFEYGLTTKYGSSISVILAPTNGTSPQDVSVSVYGLQAGTTYHYRIAATNGKGTSPGADMQFVTAATPVITWANPKAITYGTALSATQLNAKANVPGQYAYSPSIGAKLPAGNQILSVTLTPTDTVHYATTQRSVPLTVNKATAKVTVAGLSQAYNGQPRPVTVTTVPAGLRVVVTYAGGSDAPINGGSYPVTATVGEDNYTGSASGTLNIAKSTQTITFPTPPTLRNGDADYPLAAAASSGLTVSYVSSAPLVATIVGGNKLHILGAGKVTITASQAGDVNWNAARAVAKALTIGKRSQTIDFPALAGHTMGDADFAPGASASSGLTVSYASATPKVATIVAGKIHLVGKGTAVITASQAGDKNWDLAPPVKQTLTVAGGTQTITFPPLPDKGYGTPDFAPGATVPPGLTVTYTSSVPTVATIVSGKIHITGVGTSTITANQAGNTNWAAAPPATQLLTVVKGTPVIIWANPAPITYGTALSATQLNAKANVLGTGSYTPVLGSKLPVGAQTLNVIFTPTDTVRYNTATKSVPMTVNNAADPVKQTLSVQAQAGVFAVQSTPSTGPQTTIPDAIAIDATPYGVWKTSAFTNPADRDDPAISGEMATPANDGITNLMKYALVLAPMSCGTGGLPTAAPQGGYLTLTYRKNKQATDATYTVQSSDSLTGTWATATTVTSQSDQGTYTLVTVRDTVPSSGHPQRFMRLQVSR